MGSVEVYDPEQQKWVPYNPDPEALYQHLKDLRDGFVKPDYLGRYIVGSGKLNRQIAEMNKQTPHVNLVSPVAQANEIAMSDLTRERRCKNSATKRSKNYSFVKSKQPRLDFEGNQV